MRKTRWLTRTYEPLFFPHLADGGGFTFSMFLLNASSVVETGMVRILGNDGSPLAVQRVGDPPGAASVFNYNIAPGGFYVLTTDGSPSGINVGSVQVMPDTGTFTPAGAGLFSYAPGGTLITESGILSATPTTRARIFVDRSTSHNTGLAIAAPGGSSIPVTLTAFQTDGITAAGRGSLNLSGNGHDAKFANEYIPSLPSRFTGVLDIAASTPFSRSRCEGWSTHGEIFC